MRNDTHFNRLRQFGRLTLVNSNAGETIDTEADDVYPSSTENLLLTGDADQTRTTLIVFVAVSIACATAAVATGSYAVWLARHQSAHRALTDVNDILKSCQTRMRQLEADVQRLPGRQA